MARYIDPDIAEVSDKQQGLRAAPAAEASQARADLAAEQARATAAYQAAEEASGRYKSSRDTGSFNPVSIIAGMAISYFLPGVGSAIANTLLAEGIVTSELAASVIGNAIANTAASVAQGQPLDKALTNAVVSVAVNTGSIELAKEANALFKHPSVTDALISAGASAVKTAAAGGTEEDIARNMGAALAGSAASTAYQSAGDDYTRQTGRVIGSAVAGAVTGGTTGAITGAVGELGGQAKGKVSGAIEDKLKGTTDTKALPASQVEVLNPPTDAGALSPVTVTGQIPSDVTGTNIISPAPVATPSGGSLPPVTVTAKRPDEITDTDILDTIANEKKPDAQLKRVEISGKKEEPLVLETKTITGKADGTLAPVTITRKADEPAATPEEKTPEEKPYKPDLFILGGKKPKAPPSSPASDSVLSQALGTTTGLTAARGAGEIEDPSTGKKKRKVWNEETLRLKDALGV